MVSDAIGRGHPDLYPTETTDGSVPWFLQFESEL